MPCTIAIVIPTLGRPSLRALLQSLAECDGPPVQQVILVDDRPGAPPPPAAAPGWLADRLVVRRSFGRGPAAARNVGWHAAVTDWVAFLDDDVRVTAPWLHTLWSDLEPLPESVAGSQGRIHVPLPSDRRPTDWERGVVGLLEARWVTADMAYRRDVLARLHGFDERFRHAYREDSDLALRCLRHDFRLVTGTRVTVHPVRPASWWASVSQQRGNADDALMRHLHGRDWSLSAGGTHGRRPAHLAMTGSALTAGAAAALGRRRIAAAAATLWGLGWLEFAWARYAPGPRDRRELAAVLATSAAIPPTASVQWLRGLARYRDARPWPADPADRALLAAGMAGANGRPTGAGATAAILFDRDGTLLADVAHDSVPSRVHAVYGVRAALDRARRRGVRLGAVTQQPAVAEGRLRREQVDATNAEVDEMLGRFDTWQVCPHARDTGCDCRMPRPGLLLAAARDLDVDPSRCVLISDSGVAMAAARAAGMTGVLVPTVATGQDEIESAPTVFRTVAAAVDAVLAARTQPPDRVVG